MAINRPLPVPFDRESLKSLAIHLIMYLKAQYHFPIMIIMTDSFLHNKSHLATGNSILLFLTEAPPQKVTFTSAHP